MALVVGTNVAVCLHVLITNQNTYSPTIARFYPLHWWGVAAIFISGVALLIAYPAKALTNPVFYIKLVALISALIIARVFQLKFEASQGHSLNSGNKKKLAALALSLWVITIFAGRFLAYTHSVLLASRYY